MKKLQVLYGVTAVLVITLGIVGCNLMEPDVKQPTSPVSSSAELTPMGAGEIANFYVASGVSDFYGVYVAGTSFVVNIPKPGAYLVTYYTKGGFGITTYTVDNLRLKGVPENILIGLRLLVDQEFTTKEEFLAAIAGQIGDEPLVLYRSIILRYAGVRPGGPYHIVAKVKKNSLLYIGLLPGDQVLNAAIHEGDATVLAATTPDAQDFGSVTLLFKPGFIGTWTNYFIMNPLIPQIILVSDGAIVININVIALEMPRGVAIKTQHYTKPKSKKSRVL